MLLGYSVYNYFWARFLDHIVLTGFEELSCCLLPSSELLTTLLLGLHIHILLVNRNHINDALYIRTTDFV